MIGFFLFKLSRLGPDCFNILKVALIELVQCIQVLFRKDELQLTINIQQQKDHHEDPQVPAKRE